jgi:hypothetical protein
MRNSAVVLLCLLAVPAWSFGQELMPRQTFTGWFANGPTTNVPKTTRRSNPKSETPISDPQPVAQASLSDFAIDACNSHGCTGNCGGGCGSDCGGLHWTHECFPRSGCPDDYCPNPFPRQCWPPYPLFYRCVPAGDCADCRDRSADDLSWWFIPKPRTLHEAIGWRP